MRILNSVLFGEGLASAAPPPGHECPGYKSSAGQAGFKKALFKAPFMGRCLGSPAIHRRARAWCLFFGFQSALDPAGPQAARIGDLWWLMLWVCTAVYILVLLAMLWGAFRRRRAEAGVIGPVVRPGIESERRLARWVGAATAVSAVILLVFLVASVATGRSLDAIESPQAVNIDLVGMQWWWQVQYSDPMPSRRVITANEIHIPVGKPVHLRLASLDVIHSFWVPNLNGKKDLIPGKTTETWIRADHPGVFRGQCAEFCGWQHANMALLVIAEPPERFAAWLESQRQPAAQPATPLALRGRAVFESQACPLCHNIQGTQAGGSTGPDLTHLASRRTLAAGALPNSTGNLAGWILDPQTIKPGNRMPAVSLATDDLQALLAYLETLR
jgi:cytochrome c oxidase subunit 2